ncbi:MAG: hypothetical protein KY468_20150 [Armatimonadetes bacterium]|nr:hypothetical protein [Armatimonadota bacterium]
MEDLRARLEAMEAEVAALKTRSETAGRKLGWWRGIAGGMGAVTLLALSAGGGQAGSPAPPNTVRLPFRVVNAQGKTVFDVDADKDGPRMRLLDASGTPRAVIYGDSKGGHLAVFNRKGGVTAGLTNTDTGGAMSLANNTENPAVVVFSDTEGGAIMVYNQAEEGVGGLVASKDGGNLALFTKTGKDAVEMSGSPEGGKLSIYGANGKPVFSKPD